MNTDKNVLEVRMLTSKEAESYTGMGRKLLRKWAESIGAVQKIGSRVLFDKHIIDRALDKAAKDTTT